MDEATGTTFSIRFENVCSWSLARIASVDYETDHKIQETISNEFHDRTILCIARKKKKITRKRFEFISF